MKDPNRIDPPSFKWALIILSVLGAILLWFIAYANMAIKGW